MRKFLFIIFMILLIAAPVFAQDAEPVETDTLETILDFIIEANVLQWLVMLVLAVFLGRSVPQSYIDKKIAEAKKTDTPIDDLLWEGLDAINSSNKESQGAEKPDSSVMAKLLNAQVTSTKAMEDVSGRNLIDGPYTEHDFNGKTVTIPNGWRYYYVLSAKKQHCQIEELVDLRHLEMRLKESSGNFGFERDVYLESRDYRFEVGFSRTYGTEAPEIAIEIFGEDGVRFVPEKVSHDEERSIWQIDAPPAAGVYTLRVFARKSVIAHDEDGSVIWKSIELI